MRLVSKATILVFIAYLAPGIAGAEPETQNTVRIAGSIYLGDLPTWVARDRDLFAAHGLEAALEFGDSGSENMQRLRAGDADFALMALTPVLLDRLSGAARGLAGEAVILSSVAQSHELSAVVTSAGRGIIQPTDLRGRRVAVAFGTSTEFLWWLFCHFHGIEHESVERIDVPFSEMPEAMLTGRVDAALIPEPWGSELEDRINDSYPGPLIRFQTRDIYATKWVLVTSRTILRDRPDVARRLLAGYHEAIEFIERDPADALAKYKRSAGVVNEIGPDRWQSLDYDLKLDWSLIANLQQELRWAREAGYDKTGRHLSVLDMIEMGPLLDIRPAAVNLPVGPRSAQQP